MSQTQKFSLYMVPEEGTAEREQLDYQIKKLAEQFNAPVFVPHITWIADVEGVQDEILERAQKLAAKIQPFEVELGIMDFTDGVFQTLVVRVSLTKELRDVNKTARDIFLRHADGLYVPHISLLYKTGIENDEKRKLIVGLENQFEGKKFKVKKLYVFTSVPEIEKCQEIARIPL